MVLCVFSGCSDALAQDSPGLAGGNAYALLDGVVGSEGIPVYASFPGQHQKEWNFLVALAVLMIAAGVDEEDVFFSTACVFLPKGDPLSGKHRKMPHTEKCWCHKLYNEPKPWGCAWFTKWLGLLIKALKRGQKPVVVYKKGQVGEGDERVWSEFPIPFSTDRRGLGGSQAGEVAMVKELLSSGDFQATDFEKVDADQAAERMFESMAKQMSIPSRARPA